MNLTVEKNDDLYREFYCKLNGKLYSELDRKFHWMIDMKLYLELEQKLRWKLYYELSSKLYDLTEALNESNC